MKNIILFLWQLPQAVAGLVTIVVTGAHKIENGGYWFTDKGDFGVSLGPFVVFADKSGTATIPMCDIRHERGHQKQSLYLGPLYLLLIGLPSAAGNIIDRVYHKHWKSTARYIWYYRLPWEAWADKLGDVKRFKEE